MSNSDIIAKREGLILELLDTIPTENCHREGLKETPTRVAKMYDEIFGGYEQDPEKILSKNFATDNKEMVIVKDIDYYSQCEHHMVPFFGKVHIGYIPNGKVVGLSKLARLVEVYARRLQIQEQMTFQIADALEKYIKPQGLAVVVTGTHLCMCMRGIKKANSVTITNALRGNFLNDPAVRSEFFSSIHNTLK